MNQLNSQKLIFISKTMLLVFRILFIILLLMAIIPWLLPDSELGKFLLSFQGFPSVIEKNHKNINEFMSSISFDSRMFGFIGSALELLPLLLSSLIMVKLSKNYINGTIFSLDNAKSYSRIGIVYLISALLLEPIYQIFFSLCVTIHNPAGMRVISFTLGTKSLNEIFFAIALIIIGHVMTIGHKIAEDQELTI